MVESDRKGQIKLTLARALRIVAIRGMLRRRMRRLRSSRPRRILG
jgi:hypothetical protein